MENESLVPIQNTLLDLVEFKFQNVEVDLYLLQETLEMQKLELLELVKFGISMLKVEMKKLKNQLKIIPLLMQQVSLVLPVHKLRLKDYRTLKQLQKKQLLSREYQVLKKRMYYVELEIMVLDMFQFLDLNVVVKLKSINNKEMEEVKQQK